MKIIFWPAIIDEELVASVKGDVLKINGEVFDFSPITEGMQLPGAAVGSFWIVDIPITRINGELTVTVKLPVSWDTPEEVRSPETPFYVNVTNGPLKLPDTKPKNSEALEIENKQAKEVNLDGLEQTDTDSDT